MTINPLRTLLGGVDSDDEDARILEAAIEQFALTGVRRTSLDDIAGRAGVNRVTVYRRLGAKSEIVAAAFLHEAGRVLARIDSELGEIGPDRPDVDRYIVNFFVVTLTTLRHNQLLQRLLEIDRDETLRTLTVDAGRVLELAATYLGGQLHRIRERSGGSTDPEQITMLSGTLARLTQSLVLTTDGPPTVQTEPEMRRFAESLLVPIIRGD